MSVRKKLEYKTIRDLVEALAEEVGNSPALMRILHDELGYYRLLPAEQNRKN